MTLTCDAARDLAPGFVLGALEPDEERAVREHLATCDQPHPEFEAFGGVVSYLDETVELMEPKASLKARVLAAVAAAPRDGTAAPAAHPAEPAPRRAPATSEALPAVPVAAPASIAPATERRAAEASPDARPREDGARRRPGRITALLGLAAVVAIVALAGWNVLLQGQVSNASRYERAVGAVLDLAAREGSQTAILTGDGGAAPHGIAAVAADGSIVLAMRELQPTAGSEVYAAWAIPPDGGPVAIGDLAVADDGTASLTSRYAPTPGLTIALTREARPGATNPTGLIVSKGAAISAPPP